MTSLTKINSSIHAGKNREGSLKHRHACYGQKDRMMIWALKKGYT